MIRYGQDKRQQDLDYRKSVHAVDLEQFLAQRKALRAEAKDAWVNKQYGAFVFSGIKVIANAFKGEPAPPVMAAATEAEKVWQSGNDGESQLLTILNGQLNSEWTALTGYKNRKGEADLLLVGPKGVLGIEIKHLNGLISCAGNDWYRDKYDNYGNLVEKAIPIVDGRGRSPAQQINEVCGDLRQFLNKRQQYPLIATSVVLTHPKSWIDKMDDLTVDFVWRADSLDVTSLLTQNKHLLRQEAMTTLVNLIIQDHVFHAKRKPVKGSRRQQQTRTME